MKTTHKLMILSFGLLGVLGGFLVGEKPLAKAQVCHQENYVAIKCTACLAPGPGTEACGDVEGEIYGCNVYGPINCCGPNPRLCDD